MKYMKEYKVKNRSRHRKRYHQITAGLALFFFISAFSVLQVEAFCLPLI